VIGLAVVGDLAVLDLDEIADMHVLAEFRARAQPRVRSDASVRPDLGVLEVAERLDTRAGADRRVAIDAVRADGTPSSRCTRPSNTQPTSMVTSRPQVSSPRTSMRAGSSSVTPASSRRWAMLRW
jgi:hypothetical protein